MSNKYKRLKEVLQKVDTQLTSSPPDFPLFICTLGSERSFRTEYTGAITARVDDFNHLIAVEIER